jgi:hypothetical protein
MKRNEMRMTTNYRRPGCGRRLFPMDLRPFARACISIRSSRRAQHAPDQPCKFDTLPSILRRVSSEAPSEKQSQCVPSQSPGRIHFATGARASAYTRPSICMESNFVTPCCQPPGVGQAFEPDICRDKRVSPERLAYMGTLTITGLRPECLIGKAALATGRHHGHFHVRPSSPSGEAADCPPK